jgi:hypothetical protein
MPKTHQLQTTTSESRQISNESEPTDWNSNYRLLRNLYPDWKPTDEILREVWFRAFDKPHGMERNMVAQDLLREAIVKARQTHTWKEPNLEMVSRFYRVSRVERMMNQEKEMERNTAAQEAAEAAKEHQQRIRRIAGWHQARREAAVARVAHRFPYLQKQTVKAVDEWSALMTGLVSAADEEISNAH